MLRLSRHFSKSYDFAVDLRQILKTTLLLTYHICLSLGSNVEKSIIFCQFNSSSLLYTKVKS